MRCSMNTFQRAPRCGIIHRPERPSPVLSRDIPPRGNAPCCRNFELPYNTELGRFDEALVLAVLICARSSEVSAADKVATEEMEKATLANEKKEEGWSAKGKIGLT